MSSCIITIPKSIAWSEYQKELDASADGSMVLNYRLPFKPKVEIGDKCFVVYNGFIRGYQEVVGVVYQDGFECEVTGEYWREGWYIQRSGKFHTIHPKPMKGFRGIRYTDALPIDPTGKDGED